MRAGLGEGGHAAVAGLAHLVEGVFAGEVHDVDRGAGDLRHGDGAVHGFGFGARRTGEGVIDGRGLTLGEGASDDDVDDAAVFGVHADERAVLGGLGEGLEDGGVVHHEDVGIGHEELEAGHTFFHQIVHIFEAASAEIGDDHVQAVIDAGLAFGLFPPGVEGIAHAGAAGLDGEIDDAGGAAEGRGAGAGFEIVGAGGAAERHVEVGVAIDAAGEDVHAGGVDDFGGAVFRDARADFLDEFAFDEDVGGDCVGGGDDGAVAD